MKTFLWILAIGWGALGAILTFAAFFASGFFLGMLALAISAAPAFALYWTGIKAADMWARGFSEFARPASRLMHTEKLTGIALDTDAKIMYLGRDGLTKAYPFEDVREWNARHEMPGQVVGAGNITSALSGLGANVKASQTAAANTGLFLRVRDTNAAEWRISMKRKEDRDRWFEILTQAINEGRAIA